MKIYSAGYISLRGAAFEAYARATRHRLVSLEHPKDIEMWLTVSESLGKKSDFMIDSGAYSAWRKGTKVNLPELAAKVESLQARGSALFEEFHLINCDVIPGVPKTPPTYVEVQDSAEGSFRNWMALKILGIDTLPVHHQAEDLTLLDRYADNGVEYICLSPANDKAPPSKKSYCEDAFNHLYRNGHKIKTHCLGATAWDLLESFPWYSVDSATAGWNAKYGKVWILAEKRPILIGITERLLPRGGKMHSTLMSSYEADIIKNYAVGLGTSLESLIESTDLRTLVSTITFARYEDVLNKVPLNYHKVEV